VNARAVTVKNNGDRHRYELRLDQEVVGKLLYRANQQTVALIHTEIDPAFEGHGLAEQLVTAALDDIRARHVHMVPICPYVEAYVQRHPEYRDLVASDRAG